LSFFELSHEENRETGFEGHSNEAIFIVQPCVTTDGADITRAVGMGSKLRNTM